MVPLTNITSAYFNIENSFLTSYFRSSVSPNSLNLLFKFVESISVNSTFVACYSFVILFLNWPPAQVEKKNSSTINWFFFFKTIFLCKIEVLLPNRRFTIKLGVYCQSVDSPLKWRFTNKTEFFCQGGILRLKKVSLWKWKSSVKKGVLFIYLLIYLLYLWTMYW